MGMQQSSAGSDAETGSSVGHSIPLHVIEPPSVPVSSPAILQQLEQTGAVVALTGVSQTTEVVVPIQAPPPPGKDRPVRGVLAVPFV